jgi:hypothetical protein
LVTWLCNKYKYNDGKKETGMSRACSTNEDEDASIYERETERNRPLERHRCRLVDNIKVDLKRESHGPIRLKWFRITTSRGLL